jgi:hypothetical protein
MSLSRFGLGILAMLLAALAVPAVALACRCIWAGPFTKVALATELVVIAEVRSYERHGMDVAVVEVLGGEEGRRTIRVWGDDGALCRPYVTLFPRGTRWLFALQREGASGSRDYAISGCGAFWLEIRGNRAIGHITVTDRGTTRESVSLAEMRAWIRSSGATPLDPQPLR